MSVITSTLSLVAGALTVGVLGTGIAHAEPASPPPPLPAEAEGAPAPAPIELVGEPPAPNAPRKPAEVWNNKPVVWTSMWGGRWGVWINGMFMPLTSNVVTNGG